MKSSFNLILFCILFLKAFESKSQTLQPGFDPKEYYDMVKISARMAQESTYYSSIANPDNYEKVYQSPEMGLKNLWQL